MSRRALLHRLCSCRALFENEQRLKDHLADTQASIPLGATMKTNSFLEERVLAHLGSREMSAPQGDKRRQ